MLYQENELLQSNNIDINMLPKLEYNFSINERFVHVKDKNGNYFECETPFLKILKPIHTTLNKKKTIAKKYLILETNDELDFNNQIGDFMFIINKIHEVSQEKIRAKSLSWFNTEFDDIGLDIKVRRPVDQQKNNEFIKICIPENIETEILKLSKGNYVLCNIVFKGLKVSSDYISEEWELKSFITQEKYDDQLNAEYICNTVGNIDNTNDLINKVTLLDKDEHEIKDKHEHELKDKHENEHEHQLKDEYEHEIKDEHQLKDEHEYQLKDEHEHQLKDEHQIKDEHEDTKISNDNIKELNNDILQIKKDHENNIIVKKIKKNKSSNNSINSINSSNKNIKLIKKSSKKIIFT